MRIFLHLSIILITFCFFRCNVIAIETDKNFSDVFKHINNKDWHKAETLAKKSGNKHLVKIILSQKYLDNTVKDNNFENTIRFIEQNPDWPSNYILRVRAESYINDQTSNKAIRSWFAKNTPVTGEGYVHYSHAFTDVTKDPTASINIIKDGWRYGNFSLLEQKKYYKKFKKFLSHEDHVKKIDNHLLQGQVTKAKQSLYLVNGGYKKSFNAQIALIRKHKNARNLFKKVAKKYVTPGLVYYYLNSCKQDLPTSNEVIKLINLVKHHSKHGNRFCNIQSYLAREYIEKKKYKSAYKIISNHFATSPAKSSGAEFLSGWLALRFLNKAHLAEHHFTKFDKLVKTPISKARGLYWLARSHDALGNKEKAKNLYTKTSLKFPYTFYGQLAVIEIKKNLLKMPGNVNLKNYRNDKFILDNDLLKATILVCKYGNRNLGKLYLNAVGKKLKDPKDILAFAQALDKLNNVHYNTWFAKLASQKNIFIKNMGFSTPYRVKHLATEGALTYSIIRQESVFDQYGVSHAKAMGLMQLIKSTACETAKKITVICSVSKLTHDAKYNITLGSSHLGELIKNYEGSYILASAAYNAGSHNVDKWLKIYGDPRKINNHHEVIDWLELIPFYETRNYVQRVLENLQIYRTIIQKNNKLRLYEDLINKRRV